MPGSVLLFSSVGLLLSKLESFLVLFLLLVLLVTIFIIGSWELQRALGCIICASRAHLFFSSYKENQSKVLYIEVDHSANINNFYLCKGLSIDEFSRKKLDFTAEKLSLVSVWQYKLVF